MGLFVWNAQAEIDNCVVFLRCLEPQCGHDHSTHQDDIPLLPLFKGLLCENVNDGLVVLVQVG